ncbi:ankyrin repeat-containing protein [Besnoitia besnoiti]|uniref:Ankyrin repeat-containing protein n=1 Tax=Besnoitia besnoiti TaxID=94643 RepID=A0A2A9MP41_BESBE|nr:ankyrin repeat-containing protein [Besnoitia besnoiti]PFH37532.1 ankyrin repeat-containing protein [Besnoitia besnoiti]
MAGFAGKDELFKAAASGDVEFLSSHIQLQPLASAEATAPRDSASVQEGSDGGRSPSVAASERRLDAKDLHSLEDEDGRSLLHVASAAGRHDAVEFLLRAGANASKADEGQWTPLLSAASAGHLAVVKALLQAAGSRREDAAAVEAFLEARTPSGGTALATAAAKGHTAVVEALLDAGANIDARDSYGRTAVSKAVAASRESTAELLITRGASLKVQEAFTGDNVLHLAVNSENADLCLLLMKKDPELRFQKNKDGVTPFEAGRGPFLKHLAMLYEEEQGDGAESSEAQG